MRKRNAMKLGRKKEGSKDNVNKMEQENIQSRGPELGAKEWKTELMAVIEKLAPVI